jgi:hypothetical protein
MKSMTRTKAANDSFTRFREMTRKIVNTPKAVVDARAKAEKAKKAALKPA